MSSGYTDLPIAQRDRDKFGIGDYVDALAEFIVSCDTPMTISIQGGWGAGKTSLMNLIRGQLPSDVGVVWFNTWQYSQLNMEGRLSLSLLSYFLGHVSGPAATESLLRKLSREVYKGAKTMVLERTIGEVNAERLTQPDDEVTDPVQELTTLSAKIGSHVCAWLTQHQCKRLVVFVDDLDRLSPVKAVELLEVMKIFLDLPQCVFVLAVDYAIVTSGVRAKYPHADSADTGKRFFDKLIQLPFVVPVAQYDATQYVDELLARLQMSDIVRARNLEDYKRLIGASVGFNPRGLKRLFNAFLLLLNVAQRRALLSLSDEYENELRVLFGALCCSMAFEPLYETLSASPAMLEVELFERSDLSQHLRGAEEFREMCEHLGSQADKTCGKMAAFLGILWEAAQGSGPGDEGDEDTDDNAGDAKAAAIFNIRQMLSFSAITSMTKVAEESIDDGAPRRRRNVATEAEKQAMLGELRSRHGDSVTRQQLQAYEQETGRSARFIRKNCPKVGRGAFSLVGTMREPTWDDVLSEFENDALKALLREETKRRRTDAANKKINYDINNVPRWLLRLNKRDVNVWQYFRFVGDVSYWRDRLPNVTLKSLDGGAALSFNVSTPAEIEVIRAAADDAVRFTFLKRGQAGDVV